MNKVRIDKWLWAARFFKTRAQAKAAIEGGKVHIERQRTKPSKEITVGLTLQIRQGWDEKTIEVIALSDRRRGASEAVTLYRETPESVTKRGIEIEQRKALRGNDAAPLKRPTKKQRRQIHGFWEHLEK